MIDRLEFIKKVMEEPGFWDNPEEGQKLSKEVKNLKDIVDEYNSLGSSYEDIETLIELTYEEEEEELLHEIEKELNSFIKKFENLRLSTLLSGKLDKYSAILTLHAGAGGTESCDWASMLARMYQRWADKKSYAVEILDFLDGDEAGFKSITMQISGLNAYGYLKSEHGVHRLVRISPDRKSVVWERV